MKYDDNYLYISTSDDILVYKQWKTFKYLLFVRMTSCDTQTPLHKHNLFWLSLSAILVDQLWSLIQTMPLPLALAQRLQKRGIIAKDGEPQKRKEIGSTNKLLFCGHINYLYEMIERQNHWKKWLPKIMTTIGSTGRPES